MHGALSYFSCTTIGHNLRYAQERALVDYPYLFWRGFRMFFDSFWPLLLLAAAQVGWWLSILGTTRRDAVHADERRRTLLVLAWLGASFVGTASGGVFEPHYFMQLVPALATLAWMCIQALHLPGVERLGRGATRVLLVAAVILVAVLGKTWYYLPGNPDVKARASVWAKSVCRVSGGRPVLG